jgi:hypothetical protein
VQLDGSGCEPASVVAQHECAVEAGSDGCCLAGQLAHLVPVTGAGSGISGGLDQEPAFGC